MSTPTKVPLSVLDATFLRIEAPETPMHVAALMVFTIPDSAGPSFVADIVARFREPLPLRRPFNQRLVGGIASKFAPAWETVDEIDMEYHVRHSALPQPAGERELGELVSHLHTTHLDRTRPLWLCHVIEGIEGNRFAVYVKIHHSMTDGVNGIRLATGGWSTTPDGAWRVPWHADPEPRAKRERKPRPERKRTPVHQTVGSLAKGFAGLRRKRGEPDPVRVPFEAPVSVVNAPVTNARRAATQMLSMERMREVAHRTGTTLNDVFVAVCGDALRRYLSDRGELPDKPLIGGVPVSLRAEGQEGGNAVGFLWADLGTDIDDPIERLGRVHRSMNAAKEHLNAMDPSARPVFTMMTMALPIAVLMTGQGARIKRPSMNVTISNVPGPTKELYLDGAAMQACYPISLLFQGLGLNISCFSYAGQFDVGVLGGRDALPSLQRIAVYLGEALDTLERESKEAQP